jgi:hypothetical protein
LVAHQRVYFPLVVPGNFLRVEVIECCAIVVAFSEDGVPAQAGLCAFEDEEFE